jgi:hypothetical protein
MEENMFSTLFLSAALALAAPAPQETAAPVPSAAVKKWEYKVLDSQFTKKISMMSEAAKDDEKAFNELGVEGWELVSSVPKTDPSGKPTKYFYYWFKRPTQ